MTIADIVDVVDEQAPHGLGPQTSITHPPSADDVRANIRRVVERAALDDEERAIDYVTLQQVKERLASDTGGRISLDELAADLGFDAASLRAARRSD